MNLRGKQIAFDFDGTITQENIYPNVGAIRPLMDKCIQRLYNDGAHIIIWTCRSTATIEQYSAYLKMLAFLKEHQIPFHCINSNTEQDFVSQKIFAHLYVDDAALGWNPNWNGNDIYDMICKRLS